MKSTDQSEKLVDKIIVMLLDNSVYKKWIRERKDGRGNKEKREKLNKQGKKKERKKRHDRGCHKKGDIMLLNFTCYSILDKIFLKYGLLEFSNFAV